MIELKNLASDNPELKKDLIAKLTKEIRRLEAAREKSQDRDTEAMKKRFAHWATLSKAPVVDARVQSQASS